MRQQKRFALFFAIVTPFVFGLSEGRAELGFPCPPGFAKIAERAAGASQTIPNRLSALRSEIPNIGDPEKFQAVYAERLAQWQRLNPGVLPNVPMSENKPAVDWIKESLLGLEKNQYYRYPDELTRALTQGARKAQTAKLLADLKIIEQRGYPTRDVLTLADNFIALLRGIDRAPDSPGDFSQYLKKQHGATINLTESETRRLRDLELKSYSNNSVGEEDLRNKEAYREALVAAFNQKSRELGLNLDMNRIERQFTFRWGFAQEPGHGLANEGVTSRPLRGPNPILFMTKAISIRGLAEATLFKIEIAGLIRQPIKADGAVMNPHRFLQHDFNHMRAPHDDAISKKVVAWSSEKKHQLLNNIDAIRDAHKKNLSEHALLVALREFPDQGGLFRDEVPEHEWISWLRDRFEMLGYENLSDADAKTAIQWWKENLPLE